MSKQVEYADAKPGMWAVFDVEKDKDDVIKVGHYMGELHEMIHELGDLDLLSLFFNGCKAPKESVLIVDCCGKKLPALIDGQYDDHFRVKNLKVYENNFEASISFLNSRPKEKERIDDWKQVRDGDIVHFFHVNDEEKKLSGPASHVNEFDWCWCYIYGVSIRTITWVFDYATREKERRCPKGPEGPSEDKPVKEAEDVAANSKANGFTPGFWRAGNDSVWVYDGACFTPIRDKDGNYTHGSPVNADMFMRIARRERLFPFTKILYMEKPVEATTSVDDPNLNGDRIPDKPGLWKAATGSVWYYDGYNYRPITDHNGGYAPSYAQGPVKFLETSREAGRFPFTRMKLVYDADVKAGV
ncbi:hypothetical protein [Bifidobacterium oedipodis]|uniref:Uncharacterized protein n=1 Tax=Bifidobacterium oedipodis TaxID=2675322 RepID=A0A7Y0HTQ3_9BIFI|nr:hypothetical protein [Bifidobacterium sp. DSM 109957]NMM93934.1 hypothetical protein [Bifidobacterium sp. DSM 109957]